MESLTPWHTVWDTWRATYADPARIAARQETRLADMIAFARAHSRYYAAKYAQLPASVHDLQQIPPVTKRELMARFDDWVTDPAVTRAGLDAFVADKSRIGERYLGRYMVYTTSGSSGMPAMLVHDPGSLVVMNALAYARGIGMSTLGPSDLWRILRGGARQAAVLATGGHFLGAGMIERRRRDRPWRAKMVRIFSVLTPLPDLVQDLNSFQPVLLGGYASALALLAHEQQAGRLHIHPVLIASSGETLTPGERKRIATVFGCHVLNNYSASEAVGLTFECKRQRFHVNADWYILEPVDAEYRPVPPGRPSHTVLVTNLANRVQPIIRYDLGDSIAQYAGRCSCGSPLPVIRVQGRTDEILAFPATNGARIRLLPMALETVVEETPGVVRYQLIQTAPTCVQVRLEAGPPDIADAVWLEVAGRLHAYFAAQGLPAVSVERAAQPPLPSPRSGKFRHVWADLPSVAAGTPVP